MDVLKETSFVRLLKMLCECFVNGLFRYSDKVGRSSTNVLIVNNAHFLNLCYRYCFSVGKEKNYTLLLFGVICL